MQYLLGRTRIPGETKETPQNPTLNPNTALPHPAKVLRSAFFRVAQKATIDVSIPQATCSNNKLMDHKAIKGCIAQHKHGCVFITQRDQDRTINKY